MIKKKRKKDGLHLTDKKHPKQGIASTILGLLSLVLFLVLCILSGQAGGNAGIWIDQYLGLCPWDDQPEAGEYPPAVSVTWCDHQRIDGSYVSGDLYYWNGMICNYENNINTIKNDSVSLWGQDYFCILLG